MKRFIFAIFAPLLIIAPVVAQDATEEPTPEAPPVVVIEQPDFDARDILILVLIGIIAVQALATRNMLPLPLVEGLLGIAKDYAEKTPTTRDDELVSGAEDFVDAIRPRTNPPAQG